MEHALAGVERVVAIDATAVPELGLTVLFTDLSRMPADANQVVAATVRALLARIEELSQEPGQ